MRNADDEAASAPSHFAVDYRYGVRLCSLIQLMRVDASGVPRGLIAADSFAFTILSRQPKMARQMLGHLSSRRIVNDTSLMTYSGHTVLSTLIRARFSPVFSTGQQVWTTSLCSHSSFRVILSHRP